MKFERRLSADGLKEDLKRQILNGTLKPGGLVMSGHELVKKYHLSYQTVTRAICDLAAEGLLCRIKGKGTFVSENPDKSSKLVGLFIRTEGHIYEKISRALIETLQKEGFFPVPVDIISEKFKKNPKEIIDNMLKLDPSCLIIEGVAGFPFHHIAELNSKVRKLIFIDRFDSEISINADYVLSDYTRGGFIATRHLLSLGHRKILFLTYKESDITRTDLRLHWQMRQGYLTAIHEQTGCTDSARIFEIENKEEIDRESLKTIFSGQGQDRPTAVFSMSDFQGRMAFSVLKELGLRVPEDVALVGYWNTPWAEAMEVPMTSVSIRENKIAQHAAKCVTSERSTGTHSKIMVEPELIIRSSCGAKANRHNERELTGTEDLVR